MNLRTALCSLTLLLCLGVMAGLAPPVSPKPLIQGQTAVAGLLLFQIILELSAVPQMGFGFFSASFAVTLALAIAVSPLWALLGYLFALSVRQLLKGHGSPSFRFYEFLSDAVVVAVSLASAALASRRGDPNWLLPTAAALVVYLPVSLVLPEWMASRAPGLVLSDWMFARQLGGMQAFAVAFLGPALLGLLQVEPAMGLFLVPVTFALHRAARTELVRIETMGIEAVRNSERQARQILTQTSKNLDQTRQQLNEEQKYRASLERLLEGLLGSRDRRAAFMLLVERLRTVCPCESLILFRPTEGRLVPEFFHSPYQSRLEAALLTAQEEPIAQQSFQSGQLQHWANKTGGLLSEENCAVAIPMSGQGVLYLGRRSPTGYSELELTRLWQLTQLGAVALQSASLFAGQAAALEQTQMANRELNLWVEQLQSLLEGSRVFLIPDAQVQFDRLVQFVYLLLGCDSVALRFGSQWRASPVQGWNLDCALPLIEPVLTYGKPLLLDNLSEGPHACVRQGGRGCLVVPLTDEEGCHGCLLLVSGQARAFGRFHQELLGLLAYQYTVVLRRTELQEQIQSAQTQLTRVQRQAALSHLAADIAHEVNSPLAAVLLHLESLEKLGAKGDPTVARKAQLAKEATLRSSQIVARWLYYCQEGLGLQAKVDVVQVVRDVLDFSRRSWERAEVQPQFRPSIGPESWTLSSRPDEVQQLVVTLLEEVRWVAQELRQPTICLSLERPDSRPDGVTLVVALGGSTKLEDFYALLDVRSGEWTQLQQIIEHLGAQVTLRDGPCGWALTLYPVLDEVSPKSP